MRVGHGRSINSTGKNTVTGLLRECRKLAWDGAHFADDYVCKCVEDCKGRLWRIMHKDNEMEHSEVMFKGAIGMCATAYLGKSCTTQCRMPYFEQVSQNYYDD